MPNIEIKATYEDLVVARKIAEGLNAKFVGSDHQVDTYFSVPGGRLKLRESSLSGAQLAPYVRPNQAGPKRSDYLVIPISDAPTCKRLFDTVLGTEVIVEKVRDIFLIGNVRVHLDQVSNLGNFFEFEAVYQDSTQEDKEQTKVEALMRKFHIQAAQLIQGSYREMMIHHNERTK